MDKKGPFTHEEGVNFMKKFKKLDIGFDPESLKAILQDFTLFGILTEEISRVWLGLDLFLTMNLGTALVSVAPPGEIVEGIRDSTGLWDGESIYEQNSSILSPVNADKSSICRTKNLRFLCVLNIFCFLESKV
jgi:hypothetical protein